ncbi:MAG TPA: hypothetical protein DCS67_02245 [Clostridiales bacterium UBA8960]|jgi:hypothetical protein|nr:hypothetical protein [Clostridiales bacterium UBA8960]
MKKIIILLSVSILILGTMALSFADALFSPAKIFGDLVGLSEQEAYDVRLESGKSFGQLAEDYGVYDAFVASAHESKIAYIEGLVEKGELTREEADLIIERLENCDGSLKGNGLFGKGLGRGMMGQGFGQGACGLNDQSGTGRGAGFGGRGMMRNK